jgi:hypothetical protein
MHNVDLSLLEHSNILDLDKGKLLSDQIQGKTKGLFNFYLTCHNLS